MCRCDLYNATTNERGYLGSLNCCGDETHCVVKEDFNAPERTLYMKVSCFALLIVFKSLAIIVFSVLS
jgi:hypothetical protein